LLRERRERSHVRDHAAGLGSLVERLRDGHPEQERKRQEQRSEEQTKPGATTARALPARPRARRPFLARLLEHRHGS
jgi:hypothetical protein